MGPFPRLFEEEFLLPEARFDELPFEFDDFAAI
jgi:hypothetical protein